MHAFYDDFRKSFLAKQTGVSVSFTHAGNFIWHGGCQMNRVPYNNVNFVHFMNELC
jgi:hypothetical protein